MVSKHLSYWNVDFSHEKLHELDKQIHETFTTNIILIFECLFITLQVFGNTFFEFNFEKPQILFYCQNTCTFQLKYITAKTIYILSNIVLITTNINYNSQ